MIEYDRELCGRVELALERISEIPEEHTVAAPFDDYFQRTAAFILMIKDVREFLANGGMDREPEEKLAEMNRRMYEDILPENYGKSYANPAYAVRRLGEEYGKILSFLYAEIRGLIRYVFDGDEELTAAHLELFLEIYGDFARNPDPPAPGDLSQTIYWFESDYTDVTVTKRIRASVDPALDRAVRIILDSDLSDLRYLYKFGDYIGPDERELARFLNTKSEEYIARMADTYTEGYRLGFVHAKKPLEKKMTVDIRYHLGLERMVRRAIENFAEMGLRPVIYPAAVCVNNRVGTAHIGFEGGNPNPQYEYDHREDQALYLDRKFVERRLGVMRHSYETFRTLAGGYAGPAVIETFGEEPFSPVRRPEAYAFSEKQSQLYVFMRNESAQLTNRYIIGSERSFTIIDFPVPSIGQPFGEIFDAVMKVNTLDNDRYTRIQQAIIDALDRGTEVHVRGCGDNHTDLTVMLHPLKDPAHETIFENCVADVNIPVGEVFTSPQLEGTNGVLHVTQVYLNGLDYRDLEIRFADGMIREYSCRNFEKEEDNQAYIEDNVLFHHPTLPLGEFAIGTNTAAYAMGRKYRIGAKMPILIAEKTGPHFAVGDTCYSFEEDNPVYNPDGKEIIARDNSITLENRKSDPSKAYFGCHTDITIPYDELGLIEVLGEGGYRRKIIEDGRFVLPGTEELNEPLLNLDTYSDRP